MLNNLKISRLMVRSNYVQKIDIIALRVLSSFLGYFFVVRLHNVVK